MVGLAGETVNVGRGFTDTVPVALNVPAQPAAFPDTVYTVVDAGLTDIEALLETGDVQV